VSVASASPGQAEQTGPGPPAGETCPLCSSPLRAEQEWCLRCGAAARTRLASTPGWRTPLVALGLTIVLALGVLTAALVKLAGGPGTTAATTITRTVTAPVATTPAPGTTTPGAATTTPGAQAPGATAPGGAATRTTTAGAGRTVTTPSGRTITTPPGVTTPSILLPQRKKK
jgi:hypothetical protein